MPRLVRGIFLPGRSPVIVIFSVILVPLLPSSCAKSQFVVS
jgi:hypothetical protein